MSLVFMNTLFWDYLYNEIKAEITFVIFCKILCRNYFFWQFRQKLFVFFCAIQVETLFESFCII